MTPSTAHSSPTPTYRSQKRKLSDLCNLEESDNDPDNDPNDLGNNLGNGNDPENDFDNNPDNDPGNDPGNDPVNDPVNDPFRLECTYDRQGSGRGGRGGRCVRGGRGGRGGRGSRQRGVKLRAAEVWQGRMNSLQQPHEVRLRGLPAFALPR